MAILVGTVRRRYHPALLLLPIQSWSQFASALVLVTLVWAVVVLLVGARREDAEAILGGVVLGALPALYTVLPGELGLQWSPTDTQARRLVDEVLGSAGWRIERDDDETAHYLQKLPALLRWREGEIRVRYTDDGASVHGPVLGLGLLRSRLRKRVESTAR